MFRNGKQWKINRKAKFCKLKVNLNQHYVISTPKKQILVRSTLY